MEKKILDIWLEAQVFISRREAMIAENKQREHHGEGMAYSDEEFFENAGYFQHLRERLKKL